MSWLHYLIEANIYLAVFYLCYCLFLNRDTHYMLGRVYLIFSCIIAFVLPFTQLGILKPVMPQIEIAEPVTQVIVLPANVQKPATPIDQFTFDDAMPYLYIAGVAVAVFILMFRLRKLYILTRKTAVVNTNNYKLVKLKDDNTAFSFFNYLFIGTNIPQPETIIAHELVHIRQKHSADIIFLEIVKIFNWFNPFIYLIQRSLKTIHEYIADEQTASLEQDALAYSSFLLNNAYGVQGNYIAHSFFNYNLLKKRIIMLNKNRSGKLARLKYLAVLPLCAGMLCTSTLVFSKDYGLIDLAPRKAVVNSSLDTSKYILRITNPKTNISVTGSDMVYKDTLTGVEKKYTAATLTKADQDELLQKKGLILEKIISTPVIDSVNYTLQLTAPNGTTGTGNSVVIDNRATGFKHTYSVNNPITEAEQKDLEANGYKLAVIERPKEWADTGKRLPTPPQPPKSIYNKDKKGSALVIAPQLPNHKALLPPPPPYEAAYIALYKHMAKTLRYPQSARESKTDGNVILSYRLNPDHKITDVKVERGIGKGCDEAAVNALRSFNGIVNKAPGQYYMVTVFALQGYTKKYQSIDDYRSKPNFAGVVVATGYVNAPPPPAPPKVKSKVPPPPPPIEKAPPAVKENQDAKVYDPAKSPVIIVNDKIYKIDKSAIGKKLNITTADSVMVYAKGDEYALKRWGDQAKNGVILLYGKPSITFK
ncbi:M56 family metallopeptidase [Mucilaginibacter lutimaris]|uniref:M56 family metallopeptidase n=1 Tax=Mucilaginibacter lutimaris TaxID=931629 RepID=A0ABW2ZDB2_9SPHI